MNKTQQENNKAMKALTNLKPIKALEYAIEVNREIVTRLHGRDKVKYWLCIKTGLDQDVEEFIEARSKEEAINLLYKLYERYGYTRKLIAQNTVNFDTLK